MQFFPTLSNCQIIVSKRWAREVLYKLKPEPPRQLSSITNIDPTFSLGLYSDIKMLTVLLVILTVSLQGWVPLGCLEEERIALLHLKDSLNYPNGTSLPSWIKAHANCCDWERIRCNSSTGRVTILLLEGVRNEEVGDRYLNASLFLPFQQLNVLSLSNNRIAGWVEKKGLLS